MKTPTVSKVDELAEVLEIHPLTLLTLSYMKKDSSYVKEITRLLDHVSKELQAILGSK